MLGGGGDRSRWTAWSCTMRQYLSLLLRGPCERWGGSMLTRGIWGGKMKTPHKQPRR